MKLRIVVLVALGVLAAGVHVAAADPRFEPIGPLPQASPTAAIERLGFEASRCRGTCRAFTVSFAADGTFTYSGEANVERLGEHSGQVSRAALEMVMRYVEEIDFHELEPVYPSSFSDFQTTYTTVDYDEEALAARGVELRELGPGGVKTVENQGGSAPATVWALERLLVGLLDDANWD